MVFSVIFLARSQGPKAAPEDKMAEVEAFMQFQMPLPTQEGLRNEDKKDPDLLRLLGAPTTTTTITTTTPTTTRTEKDPTNKEDFEKLSKMVARLHLSEAFFESDFRTCFRCNASPHGP